MLAPLYKICKLCLALRDHLVALHLRPPSRVSHGPWESGQLTFDNSRGRAGGCRRAFQTIRDESGSKGRRDKEGGKRGCLDGRLLSIVVRDVPLGEARLALSILQQQEADLQRMSLSIQDGGWRRRGSGGGWGGV